MTRTLNSFKIHSGNRILDYRLGENLDLKKIRIFFQEKGYQVKEIWSGSRHVLGLLEKDKIFFLKLSTSEGISFVTKNEFEWNDFFNRYSTTDFYRVPQNYGSGFYQKKYFYLITDYFKGELLCETRQSYEDTQKLNRYISQVIKLSEIIQELPGKPQGYHERFIEKVKSWSKDIPADIYKKFDIKTLLDIVENGKLKLSPKVRHGDFAPWHIIELTEGQLGLIDGEHFLVNGVENYDICYFIQRVFSVLKNPKVAQEIYSQLLNRGYRKDKLKTVLVARAIGGFLDESLKEEPDYLSAENFKNWILES